MDVRKYPEEVGKYKCEWVALSRDDRVVGHGKTPEEAILAAKAAGYVQPTQFTLAYIPDEWPKLMML